MFKKILVPVDGSPLADHILQQARRLLTRSDAELVLLRILPPKPRADRAQEWEEECARGRRHLTSLREAWNREGARVSEEVRVGDAAEEILKFAEIYGPSLIAMSTHGRTGIDRWVRGSVAERILENSPFPILLANPLGLKEAKPENAGPFRRILLPLDGSEASTSIIPTVIEFARLFESDVTLFYCALYLPSAVHLEVSREFTAEEALPVLEPHRKRFEQAEIPVRVVTALGYPPEEILAAANREQSDLVAMTTHGRSGLSRFLFGSVAEKVLRQCRVPLLIHRKGGRSP